MKRARSLIGPQYAEPVWLWTDSVDGAGNGASPILEEDEREFQPVKLDNKVALIVGGASETGAELAVSFAERGMDVAIIFFNERHDEARAVKNAVEEVGRRCLLIYGEDMDARDENSFARWAIGRILSTLGRLDVYINVSERAFPPGPYMLEAIQSETLGSALLPRFSITKAALDHIVG